LSAGQCRAESAPVGAVNHDPLWLIRLDKPGLNTLSFGPYLAINGNRRVPAEFNGTYKSTMGGNSPLIKRPKPLFFEPGRNYRVHSSDDKPDLFEVAVRFIADLDFGPLPARPINRAEPLRLTWRTAQPRAAIVLYSQNETTAVHVVCAATAAAGVFVVPPDLLRILPSTVTVAGSLTGYVGVAAISPPVPFSAPGIKHAIASSARFQMIETEFR
jgi:hypothetical protein